MKNNKNSNLLLSCLLINNVSSIFVYTYLLSFMLDISNNGIFNVATFYLVLHISMIALSWIFAPLFKKAKKSLILCLGVLSKFIFIIMVIIFKNSIINYIPLISVLNAASEVLFWAGANPLLPLVTQKNKLTSFISNQKILSGIIHLIIPISMGYFIDKSGINIVAILMGILVTIQLILSLCIHEKDKENHQSLHYKQFINSLKENYPEAKKIYLNLFLFGLCSNISTIMLYYTFITFGSNISLGIFSTITSIISIFILMLFKYNKKRFLKPRNFIVSSILMILAVTFVLINLSKSSLIIFYLVWNLSIIIPDTVTGSLRLNIIKHKKLIDYNIENITLSETYLDLGRVIGEIILLIMGIANNHIIDILCLITITIIVIVLFLHTASMKKELQSV